MREAAAVAGGPLGSGHGSAGHGSVAHGGGGFAAVTTLTRRSLADQVADALVTLILEENLQEGASLPPTAELSDRFGVSRTVVREALATLTGQGILSRSQGRECVVATPGLSDLSRLLQFRIRHDAVGPREILQCRVALEVTAAAAAAAHRTDDDIALLRLRMDELAAARGDRSFHQADIALHAAVAQASHNPLLVLMLDALVDFLREVRVQATKRRRSRGLSLDSVIDEHRRIVDAVASGDPAKAEKAMRVHLDRTAAEFDQASGVAG